MDSQLDSTEATNRPRPNADPSATLIDSSESPGAGVDVIPYDSAAHQALQPPAPAIERERPFEFGYYDPLNSDGGSSTNNYWNRLEDPAPKALTIPKHSLSQTPPEAESRNNADSLMCSISQGLSRQLPPLPDSPPNVSTSYDILNPFADPLPTRTNTMLYAGTSVTASQTSNMGPAQRMFPDAQSMSSHQEIGTIVTRATRNDNNTTLEQRDQIFDSKWAKYMEERSRRIAERQRQGGWAGILPQSDHTGVPGSSRLSEDMVQRLRRIAGWNDHVRAPQEVGNSSPENSQNVNETNSNPGDMRQAAHTLSPITPYRLVPPPAVPDPNQVDRRDILPWRRRLQEQTFRGNDRPDIKSRNAALDTISNILFNFDCAPEDAADLLEDTCATAQEVGVSTSEILAQTVTLGNFDMGMTPLCLEASRCDFSKSLNVLTWLLENVSPDSIERDLRRGCLMRNNGMGDQVAWSTMKLFIPEQDNQAIFAYDVTIDSLFLVPGAATNNSDAQNSRSQSEPVENSDDEGSLYDDISLIDVQSSLNQADIETLKSSDDEAETKPSSGALGLPIGPRSTAHRARIDIPYFESSLKLEDPNIQPAYTSLPYWQPGSSKLLREQERDTIFRPLPRLPQVMPMNNRVLTAEWMHEGRVWALAIGATKLVLTLRHASEVVSSDPIKVKALIRIFPADVFWEEVEEMTSLGPDRLLPTSSGAHLPLSPIYSWEFDEANLVPGPPTLSGNTSLCKKNIYMSNLPLLDLVGTSGAMKVEVIIKTSEISPAGEAGSPKRQRQDSADCSEGKGKDRAPRSTNDESDNEWQRVDF